jgi:ectoine hydroxylase-related dioxygenase (phytanoyl-CoA dioxygenase family)
MLEKYKEFYIENGYVVIPGHEFITEKEHKKLLEVSDKLINTDNDNWLYNSNGTINKLQGAVTIVPEFLNLAKNKVLIKFAQSISNIGDNVDCYISKFFPQQKNGNSTKWHQDNYYFKGSPKDIVSCAIYLTDTTIENGCLRIAKNTHKFDKFLDHTSSSGLDGIKWINEDTINKHEIVDLVQKGPYAVFFNINIAHGCYTNTTEENRYSLAWEYINSSNNSVVSTDQKWCDRTLVTPKYLV